MTVIMPHLIGDFLTQNQVIAIEKPVNSLVCGLHVVLYTLMYYLWFLYAEDMELSLSALVVIGCSHFIIDRWRLVTYYTRFISALVSRE